MKKRVWIGVLFIVLVLVIGFLIIINFKSDERGDVGGICEVDNDCVIVQTNCCSCNMGGSDKCVSLDEKEDYKKELESCDEGLLCAAVYNCEIETCSCVEDKCV